MRKICSLTRRTAGGAGALWLSGLLACGAEPPDPLQQTAGRGPPIELRAFDLTPGCYEAPPERPFVGAYNQVLQASTRQMFEYQLSFALQAVTLMSEPIHADPTARRWRRADDAGYVEGAVIAEGTDWSVIKMVLVGPDEEGRQRSLDATITVTPAETTYDFGEWTVSVQDDVFFFDDYARGCHPDSGVSFEIGPRWLDGRTVPEHRCWPAPFDLEADQVYRDSWALQCLQIIDSLRLR